MNKIFNKFFEKDLVLKIISVIIGIIIWFIVLDHQNPMDSRTVSVPLRTNKEVLVERNISLVSSNIPDSVDVVVKGRKQRLEKISANDFQAFLDFSAIDNTDQNQLTLVLPEYIGNQDILVSGVYPRTVKIVLERIVRKEFPIAIKWGDQLPENYEVVNVKLTPNTVILQELESIMNSVKNVSVSVEQEQLLKGDSINRRIEVYNHEDKIVSALDGSVQVNLSYDLAKTVSVSTTVVGKPNDDYYVKDYMLSQNSVQITGPYEVLKDIEMIEAEQLNVDQRDASFKEELTLQIPEQVQLFNGNSTITAQVNVEKYSYRTITLPKSSITILGGDVTGGMKYRILDENITFQVKGPGEILDKADIKDLKAYANVADLEEGTEAVEVQITLPAEIHMEETVMVDVETEVVVLSISPTPTPEVTPSPVPTEEGDPTPTPEPVQTTIPEPTTEPTPTSDDDSDNGD